MKILLLSYEYPPETGFGGIGSYTWYQARAMARRGHEVHVLAGAVAPTHLRTSEHDGVRVHRYRADGAVMRACAMLGRHRLWWTRNRLENGWSMLQGLRQLRRAHRFDVIEMPECGAEGLFVNRRAPEPTVVRFHSPAQLIMPFYDVRDADIRWCARAEARGIRTAAALSSCSRFLAGEVRTRLDVQRPITVIPNGIDVALFDAAERIDFRRRFGIPTDRPVIFFSGRMEARKGIHVVTEIAVEMLARHDVALVLAGDDLFGYVEQTLKPRLAGRSLRGSLHHLGRLAPEEVRSGVLESDIFLLPSLWENCPYACLEAMAAGRAIVASDQGGLPELLTHDHDGLLAKPEDAAGFVGHLERLLRDEALRTRLGAAARGTVEARLTDDQMARHTLAWYGRLLGDTAGATPARHHQPTAGTPA